MNKSLKQVQWLVFWLSTWLPFAIMAAEVARASTTPIPHVQDFPFAEPEFETLADAQALDNPIITALAQDARGLIWIGTQTGLVRYDGYRFRKFAHKAAAPFSLAGNYVNALSVAKDGRIWAGTASDGISVLDPASERFEHFQHDEKRPDSLGGGTIWALANDERGGMWIATEQGLDHLPVGSRRFTHFRHSLDPHSLMDDKVYSLLQDKKGRLWVGSSGLQRLSLDGKSFETVVVGREVRTLFEAQDGKLWLGTTEHGAAWLDSSQQAHWLPLAQLSQRKILGIAQVNKEQIWLASFSDGMIVVAASNGQMLQTLRHDPAVPGSLAFDSLKPLLLDRSGQLWVGTWGKGLLRMNANNTAIHVLRHSPKQPNGLSHPDVRSVLELADGRLAVGSNANGIDIIDRQRGLIGGYRTGQGKVGALPNGAIYSLAQTSDGSIWAGTSQTGVVRKFPGSTTWVAVPGLPSKQVYRLLAGRDASLWVGTALGVARLRPGTLSPQPASARNTHQAALPERFEVFTDELGNAMDARVNAIVEDRQGRIWIGAYNGLWLHEPHRRDLIHIATEPNRPDSLASDFIFALLLDSHDSLWVATDKGLERLKSRDGKLARFEHVSALLGQAGQALGTNLMEDQQGRIWTDEAVIDQVNNPARMRILPITKADGMNISGAWDGSYYKTRDGLLLQGGFGLAIIDPARFKAYDYAAPMVVTELKINGETVPPGWLAHPKTDLAASPTLTFTPAQRNFSIEFAALDYSEPKKNRYQYRLKDYEKEWINTDADHRSASYGNLWPGRYTLQVRGSNRLGDWSEHELSIPIQVLPAWWQTWWFALALLLMMTALFASLMQMRTHYLRQRQHELEQLVDKRTNELRQKQDELVDANSELNHAIKSLNQSNGALNEAIEALNHSNAGLVLSVETLRQLGDIGREITANLDAEIVFQSLYLYVGGLLNAPTMTIYRMNATATVLDAVFGRDDDHVMPTRSVALDSPTSNVARVVRERQELLLNIDPLADSSNQVPGTRKMLTALFAPLIVDDHVLGVMSIQSDHANAYGERECLIFRTLSAYGAIALANAAAIAALRQAQHQLVQQEKMASLGGLVAGIAHEINTPLGTTLMAISGAQDAWQTLKNATISNDLSKAVLDSSTTDGMEYTALALKTATRAAELIALFQTISINADSDCLVEIGLAEHLQEVAALVHSQLAQNGCQLAVAAPAGLSLHVVPEALTESLSRILVNALDHGFTEGRTGTLRLTAQLNEEDGGEEVVITISDDGHGIAPEDLPKVFDPFFTTKSGIQGHVGLGLHVAYNQITQRLKGQIHVTSTLGEGTNVEIRLKKHGAMLKNGE